MIQNSITQAYLYYSYLPPLNLSKRLLSVFNFPENTYTYSIDESINKFDQLFNTILSELISYKYVVPLSGGWDSRAILGALLERVPNNQIQTISFGAPGQLDFDLGNMIAQKNNVSHFPFDLRTVELSWDLILKTAERSPWTYILDSLFNYLCRKNYTDPESSIWIGFLGDPLTGNHLLTDEFDIINAFIKKQKRARSIQLNTYEDIKLNYNLSKYAYNNISDVLDICVRQSKCIEPIVLPLKKWDSWGAFIKKEDNGGNVIAPFADYKWAQYWLMAPLSQRRNQKLYLDMLNTKFPDLFKIPSKYSFGLKKNHGYMFLLKKATFLFKKKLENKFPFLHCGSVLMENYLDFNEAFRKRTDYQETLFSAFNFLKEHDIVPWLNLDKLWKQHRNRNKNLGDAFAILLGLAANLSVEQKMSSQLNNHAPNN